MCKGYTLIVAGAPTFDRYRRQTVAIKNSENLLSAGDLVLRCVGTEKN